MEAAKATRGVKTPKRKPKLTSYCRAPGGGGGVRPSPTPAELSQGHRGRCRVFSTGWEPRQHGQLPPRKSAGPRGCVQQEPENPHGTPRQQCGGLMQPEETKAMDGDSPTGKGHTEYTRHSQVPGGQRWTELALTGLQWPATTPAAWRREGGTLLQKVTALEPP